MKIKIPIPGEKNEIREAIQQAINKEGSLSKERKKEIHRKVHKREVHKATFMAMLFALGISEVMLGSKLKQLNASKEHNNVKIEQKEDYKETLRPENFTLEQNSTKQKVNNLKTKDEVLELIKNEYVAQRTEITGTRDVEPEDIRLYEMTFQNYVYRNTETGDIITHGEKPTQTERKLENNGVSYDIIYNYPVYKVNKVEKEEIEGEEKEKEKMIDCMSARGQGVILGDQYGESYTSIIDTMGTFIPDGVHYALCLESADKDKIAESKKKFIESLEKFEKAKENQKATEEKEIRGGWYVINPEKTDQNPEEGFEHE